MRRLFLAEFQQQPAGTVFYHVYHGNILPGLFVKGPTVERDGRIDYRQEQLIPVDIDLPNIGDSGWGEDDDQLEFNVLSDDDVGLIISLLGGFRPSLVLVL